MRSGKRGAICAGGAFKGNERRRTKISPCTDVRVVRRACVCKLPLIRRLKAYRCVQSLKDSHRVGVVRFKFLCIINLRARLKIHKNVNYSASR